MRGQGYNLGRDYAVLTPDDRTPTERWNQAALFDAAWHQAYRELNPTAESSHLAILAFLAALSRIAGVEVVSANAIYVAGYNAKRGQLCRELYPYERQQLRRAADRIWDALRQIETRQLQGSV